ncbi:type II 3-dehydroquinate dehydratase [Gammaproteobacteria bacterium]|jgi:3-dehydroquinate dehydratase-2|nr:type II 3-dehydroquinate dehydratase [Gammaproteobacteria bacterium]MDC0985133.1 type II 3-dehydroquinate dehydratase [Gammaproteobacteria bacterium]|tara:strand:- start:144 stop:575 length:432 start_codon:yes stop_codon:yes gene_type:complete
MKILVLNGPNLNLLGTREPEVYGTDSLEDIQNSLQSLALKNSMNIDFYQSNSENALIERLHKAKQDSVDYIIINPGAFTHTSIALRDAFLGVDIPFIEVHISNIYSREEFRKKSYLSDISKGLITGLGVAGYEFALLSILQRG